MIPDNCCEIPFALANACLSRSEANRTSRKAIRLKALAVLRSDSSTQGLLPPGISVALYNLTVVIGETISHYKILDTAP